MYNLWIPPEGTMEVHEVGTAVAIVLGVVVLAGLIRKRHAEEREKVGK